MSIGSSNPPREARLTNGTLGCVEGGRCKRQRFDWRCYIMAWLHVVSQFKRLGRFLYEEALVDSKVQHPGFRFGNHNSDRFCRENCFVLEENRNTIKPAAWTVGAIEDVSPLVNPGRRCGTFRRPHRLEPNFPLLINGTADSPSQGPALHIIVWQPYGRDDNQSDDPARGGDAQRLLPIQERFDASGFRMVRMRSRILLPRLAARSDGPSFFLKLPQTLRNATPCHVTDNGGRRGR